MRKFLRHSLSKNQHGAVAIIVAITLIVLLGVGALSVDIAHLAAVRNELQNGADAGALAGAQELYNDQGTSVNPGANQVAYDVATANKSQKVAVDVNWSGGNVGDVQRGHWCFATHTFTPNDSLDPVDLWDVSDEELDANLNFINAVRVVTRRESPSAASFFARIFGFDSFQPSADAVAYIGFAGTLLPEDADQPIAICKEALTYTGAYSCSIGRFINSGQNVQSHETGGWTSFNQDDPCSGGTNAQEVKGLVCGSGNPDPIQLGVPIATNGGDIQSAFNMLIQCWENKTGKIDIWNLTLPVVTCPGNNVSTCETVVGAVNLNIVWITEAGEDPGYNNAPRQMGGWVAPDGTEDNGVARWDSFVVYFNLQNVDGTPAPYTKKSIYFLPDCTPHIPAGVTGGENFGVLAKIPVLVE